jgi:hypothetical protein
LDSYCCVGRITMEFPLSALAVIAWLLFSLDLIDFYQSGFGVGVVCGV